MLKVISNLSREEKIMKTQTAIPVYYTGSSTVNNEKEIWRDVRDFEGIYEVSNMGRIKSYHRSKEGKIITPMHRNCDKYLRIALSKKGKKEYRYLHRIVAESFIYNPYGLPEVNHINCDARDCRASNLEWCDRKYNINYYLTKQKRQKKVYCYNNVNGDLEQEFNSVGICAACFNSNPSYISYLIKNNKSYKGYTLSYTRL